MKLFKKRFQILIFMCLLGVTPTAKGEDIAVTSYYPTPNATYKEIKVLGQTTLATSGASVGIGAESSASFPSSVAVLDLSSSGNRGLLLPRMGTDPTITGAALQAASKGLVIYNNAVGVKTIKYYDGANWQTATGGGGGGPFWNLRSSGNHIYNYVTALPNTGNVGISSSAAIPLARLHVRDGAILAAGTTGGTSIPQTNTEWPGFIWNPSRAAFRAGGQFYYSETSPGMHSFATGNNSLATATEAISIGPGAGSYGTGANSIQIGVSAAPGVTSGVNSIAIGTFATATQTRSCAIGYDSDARGVDSFSISASSSGNGPSNNIASSLLMRCYGTNVLFVGPSAGFDAINSIWTTGNVGIGTTNPLGKLHINGTLYQRGSLIWADYVFEPVYKLESIEDHAKYMWDKQHLKAVGPAEYDKNGQTAIRYGSLQNGLLEELEKAHIYVAQLEYKIAVLEAKFGEAPAK